MAAVVLAGQKFAGLGIDGNALPVRPVSVSHVNDIAHSTELTPNLLAEAGLEVELVRQVLVVEAGSVDGLLNIEAPFG